MAKQTVNVGTSASDGTGDDLRVAFSKVNENFTELYSGNVQVTAANILVYSVAGRTGNVELTVADIAGGVSKAYVNAAIAANIANVTGSVTDSLSANITAANLVITGHEGRISTLESNAVGQAVSISSLASTKADVSYVDISIDLALSSNAILADVDSVNANVSAANAAILLRANLSGADFTGNISAGNITAITHTYTKYLDVGPGAVPDFFVDKGASFVGDNELVYGSYLQNTNAAGSGDYFVFPDGGQFLQNYAAYGIANSEYNNPRYPNTQPGDSFIYAVGGNLLLEAETHSVRLVTANIARMEVQSSGTVKILSNITFADGSIQNTAFGGNVDVDAINANITAANVAIVSLQSNAAAQALEFDNLFANAGSQASSLAILTANASAQAATLAIVTANIAILASNAAGQASNIIVLEANSAAQAATLSSLAANAAAQSLDINNLFSNAGIQSLTINSLTSNAAIQAITLDILTANSAIQADLITTLTSNAVTQADAITLLIGNASIQTEALNILIANSAAQSLDIDALYSNVGENLNLGITNSANILAINVAIATLDSNLGTVTSNVNTLFSNAAVQSIAITNIDANVVAANASILARANLSGAVFSGNVQAEYLLANANVKIAGAIEVGDASSITYPGQAGVFVDDVDGYYQLVIQNTNSGTGSSGDFVITADDGSDETNYINIGLNSSGWSGNFIVPAGDTGLPLFPHDGYMNVIGGNSVIFSDSNVFLVANTSVSGLIKDGNFFIQQGLDVTRDISIGGNLSADGNLSAGNIIVNNMTAFGNVNYTMGNVSHWTSAVTTMSGALDQLAARIWAIENP